jgi:hypothetical protein
MFSTESQAWKSRAKSMMAKITISRMGRARANSSKACPGGLFLLKKPILVA